MRHKVGPLSPARVAWLTVAAQHLSAGAVRTSSRHQAPPSEALRALTGGLADDVALQVLGIAPGLRMLAWSTGVHTAFLWKEGGSSQAIGALDAVALRFFPEGDRLLTAGFERGCAIWSTLTGALLRQFPFEPRRGNILDAEVFPDGRRVVFLTSGRSAEVWSVDSGERAISLVNGVGGPHRAVRVFPDGQRFVTGVSLLRRDPALVWNASDGVALHRFQQLEEPIAFMALTPCGEKLATTGRMSVALWDAATGLMEFQIDRPDIRSSGIGISWGGARIVRSEGRCIVAWSGVASEPPTQTCLASDIVAFVLLPDGGRVVALTGSQVAVLDTGRAEPLLVLDGDLGFRAQSIAASPGGDLVAACGARTAQSPLAVTAVETMAWEVSSGRVVHRSVDSGRGFRLGLRIPEWPCSVAIPRTGTFLGSVRG